MENNITDAERMLAKAVSQDAMIMGWDKAIARHAHELGTSDLVIRNLLNRTSKYNDKADPPGRIDELADWEVQKHERSDRASNLATRLAR